MDNSISAYSRYRGISGLASGMDTESLVKKMLSKELAKVERIKADKQLKTWKQESYHNIMDKLKDFMSKYYNVLNSDTYFFSGKNSKKVDISNQSNTADTFVEITANSSAANSKFTINAIEQLAASAFVESNNKVIGGLTGTVDLSFPMTVTSGSSFGIALDGELKQIEIDGTFNDSSELINELNSKFDGAFGTGKIVTSVTSDNKIHLESSNSVLQVVDGTGANNFLNDVGLANGQLNIVNLYKSVEDTFGESQTINFKINDIEFSFDKNTSMKDIMAEINVSKANVVLSYSSLRDKFTITNKGTGAASEIKIENLQGDFFGANSYINIDQGIVKNGKDAVFYVDDPLKSSPITRGSNSFTIDGMRLNLKAITDEAIDFEVKQNTDGMVEKLTTFVNDFNDLVSEIEEKLYEKVYVDFQPLTDEQREEMSEKQIELWEGKAKSGIHKYDTALTKLVSGLKNAFWRKIEGLDSSIHEIGITTTKDWKKFELVIDEDKLKEEIEKDPERVMEIFNKDSETAYSRLLTSDEYASRHKEIGFARRISDILNDNMSTLRDKQGMKGILVQKAGLEGDASQEYNDITMELNKLDNRVRIAIERMNDREQYYWKKMTAMETALQRMNSQSNWLYSQFANN